MNNKIKVYRRFFNISQSEMAKIIGIGLTSYNQKEQGKKDFTYTEMATILKYFKEKIPDLTADDIFFTNGVIKLKTANV
ncbi:transcriptional regulator [Clostridium sp. HMP27]|uniref:helix-turn-helix transcriptional regulator n=1 Tax=Clostridium sp. HMP27 TaxID=1487921 RepID=UPI00052BFC65|nr:transcriptional regulator [Clostridium sp. HMP27]KGK88000.1 hypothetical protein DP68_08675 [Clostridium sp. HMP27]